MVEQELEATGQQHDHFAEHSEVKALIEQLESAAKTASQSNSGGGHGTDRIPGQDNTSLSAPTSIGVGDTIVISKHAQAVSKGTDAASSPPEPLFIAAHVQEILDRYQEQPHLLDPHLDAFVAPLLSTVRDLDTPALYLDVAFKLLYGICKVRGHKAMVKRFSHQASDIYIVLQHLDRQDPSDHERWYNRFVLLLWLSLIVLLPFDLTVLDQSNELPTRILNYCKRYLRVADLARDGAAILAARFLTRPDTTATSLPEFITWCCTTLKDPETQHHVFLPSGILSVVAAVLKIGRRPDLLPHCDTLLSTLSHCKLSRDPNTLTRKLYCKVVQRIGLTYLPARVVSWRYQRGKRSLALNVTAGQTSSSIRTAAVDALGSDAEDEDDDIDVPDEIEEVIEALLSGLHDKDTIVRWSCAKGVGRISARLPKDLADDVVESVLELFSRRHGDGAWHGACLTVAELARRGLLLPQRLKDVVPVVSRALAYDEFVGATSVGSHVRDAACYVCWAFARAYRPEVLQPYIATLSRQLLLACVFDRETPVRRAAAAALQENVGRLGTIPHGIDLIGRIDYFAVGQRSHAFTELASLAATYDVYRSAVVQRLVETPCSHWDAAVRSTAASALHCLGVGPAPADVLAAVVTLTQRLADADLNVRHGAMLAVGEGLRGLSERTADAIPLTSLDAGSKEVLSHFVGTSLERGHFRGMNGVHMRQAACIMIRNLSACKGFSSLLFAADHASDGANITASQPLQGWFDFVLECLMHSEDRVRDAALSAFTALARCTLATDGAAPLPSSTLCLLLQHCTKTLCNALQQVRAPSYSRTHSALALGNLPVLLLDGADAGNAERIWNALEEAARVPDGEESAAMCRASALTAAASLILSACEDRPSFAKTRAASLSKLYQDGLADYSTDSHGDVGSHARHAAMVAIERTLIPVLSTGATWAQLEGDTLLCLLVKQSLEKIDRMRAAAGEALGALLEHLPASLKQYACDSSGASVGIEAGRSTVVDILAPFIASLPEHFDWAAGTDVYRHLSPLLNAAPLRRHILAAMCVSVGGLTESLARSALRALVETCAHMTTQDCEALLFTLAHIGRDAVAEQPTPPAGAGSNTPSTTAQPMTQPFLQSASLLLSCGSFDVLPEGSTAPQSLYEVVKSIGKGNSNVKQLLACASVHGGLLLYPSTEMPAVKSLLLLCCHKFPRVRKGAAEALVLHMQAAASLRSRVSDDSWGAVLEQQWDSKDMAPLRKARNAVLRDLGVEPPKTKQRAAAPAQASAVRPTEISSYKDLVERAGY